MLGKLYEKLLIGQYIFHSAAPEGALCLWSAQYLPRQDIQLLNLECTAVAAVASGEQDFCCLQRG